MSAARAIQSTGADPGGSGDSGLRRGLNSIHVVSIVVSSIIGTGIFIRSASMMQDVGTAPLLMAAWIVAGLLTLAGALSYAELCTLMPRAGGEYVFLREAFGRPAAFLFGWMRFVVGAGMSAAVAVGVATFLGDAFSLSAAWSKVSVPLFGYHLQLYWGPRQIITLAAIGILAVLNCRAVRASGTTQAAFAGFKVAALLILIVAAVLAVYSGAERPPAAPLLADAHVGFPLAVLAALQAYNGWVFAAMLGGEVADCGRNYARDIIVGTLIVITLYVLVNTSYVMLLSPSEIASSNSAAHPEAVSVGAKLARVLFGSWAGAVMSVAFAISALGALHCNLLSNPRIFYAMARDGLFVRALGTLDGQTNVPRAAVIAYSGWTAVLTLLGGFDRLSNMAVFSFYIFYCANVVALFHLRRKRRDADRPFVVPGYPWVPLAFLLASLSVLVATVIRGAPEVIWALVLLTLGLPAYLVFRGIYRPAAVGPPAAA
jgi:APA family basic amino acid/polyamine antiporter